MRGLLEPVVTELDPETQAICDEVCEALADPWFTGSAARFGHKLKVAMLHSPDLECRQRIYDAVDAGVRSDPDLVLTVQGHIFSRADVRAYGGRESYVVDSATGETQRIIEWPTGRYAGGAWSYEKPEAA